MQTSLSDSKKALITKFRGLNAEPEGSEIATILLM